MSMEQERKINRAVTRRMMLHDIQRGRQTEAFLQNKADELQKKARMVRVETDGIVKKLAAFDIGGQ